MWGITNVWAEYRDERWRELAGQTPKLWQVSRRGGGGGKVIRAASEREARELFARIRSVSPTAVVAKPARPAMPQRRWYGCGQ